MDKMSFKIASINKFMHYAMHCSGIGRNAENWVVVLVNVFYAFFIERVPLKYAEYIFRNGIKLRDSSRKNIRIDIDLLIEMNLLEKFMNLLSEINCLKIS